MTFYIIPSPVGNLDDFTIRAIDVIGELDFLVVENKLSAQKLLKKYSLNVKNIFTYNDHSSEKDRIKIVKLLKEDKAGGIISEAGTPLISDPGYKLVSSIINENIRVIPLPGPTSVIPALVASGLPSNKFHFFGFLPKKENDIQRTFSECMNYDGTSIFFESSRRIRSTLELMNIFFGANARICLAKEISKIHESFFRGTAKEILAQFDLNEHSNKGEFILLLDVIEKERDISVADKIFDNLKDKLSMKEIAKLSSQITGLNKNFLYERFLSFSKKS